MTAGPEPDPNERRRRWGLALIALGFCAVALAVAVSISGAEQPQTQPQTRAQTQPQTRAQTRPGTRPAKAVAAQPRGPMHTGDDDAVAYHVCPMHPSVKTAEPGSCPQCSMPLEPVTRGDLKTGEVRVDPGRLQMIGVRTATVTKRPLAIDVVAPGSITYDETRLSDVSIRYPAWIGKLHVNKEGQYVKKGQVLFTLYSYELYMAQRELHNALELEQRVSGVSQVDEARRRLRRLNVADKQIAEMSKRTVELDYVPIASQVSGYVIEKNVVEGAGIAAGTRLYRIAQLDRVWVEADVYLQDLPLLEVGSKAEVTLTHLPDRRFEGTIGFIYPFLDDGSPTGRMRVELDNPNLELRPGMFADVHVRVDRGERLTVPESAVIYAGPRRLVFLDLGSGRFRPRDIEVGHKSGDDYEVRNGLAEGDVVVTPANFLIAAESRLKSATGSW